MKNLFIDMVHKILHDKNMRYALSVKQKVRSLREKGKSLGKISIAMNLPKSTVKLWTTDILLSKTQKKSIAQRANRALQQGRIKAQAKNRNQRSQEENQIKEDATAQLGRITQHELLIAGIALYWGEGFKSVYEHRLGFCNSDPHMIKFYILWLRNIFGVKDEDLVLRLTLNESHKDKTGEMQGFWIKTLKISKNQFTKPFYQKSIWKRQYKTDDYHGVLRVHVKNSLRYLWQMRGWIEGLKNATILSTNGKVAQLVRARHS